jgi:hypothetical protein
MKANRKHFEIKGRGVVCMIASGHLLILIYNFYYNIQWLTIESNPMDR